MRLKSTISNENAIAIKEFVDWIIDIGDRHMDLNENGEGKHLYTTRYFDSRI